MTTTPIRPSGVDSGTRTAQTPPVVDVVIPVHDEETDLEPCIRRLHAHLSEQLPYPFAITVAENASTDHTVDVARRLAAELPGVRLFVLPEPGRGRALRTAWLASEAPVLVYMDVDLSTDLAALLPLVAPLISGHSDLAIGTRLVPSSRVVRGTKRELISRGYNLLLRGTLATRASDAQCGFKAIRADVATRLLPLVEDTGWFFDTELLVLAERSGLRIHEVPVDWIDDPDSRVDIIATAKADLAGITRMLRALTTGRLPLTELRAQLGRGPLTDPVPGVPPGLVGQLIRFAAIGALSTLAYLALFLLLRGSLGAQPANLLALGVTAVANTAANRRITFGIRGGPGAARAQFQGLLVFTLGLVLTSGSLAALHALTPTPAPGAELLLLLGANALATLLRFLLFRGWVFRSRDRPRAGGPRARCAPAPSSGPAVRVRLILLAELVGTAALYGFGTGRAGWANSYYSAAAQAGSMSWHAFLFGSLDPAGGITVDKPPAALWLMGLSVRVFGLSTQALLLPQAACGVAAVALLYAAVRRQAGAGAGLVAAGLFAVTPVVTLLARDDNPDALMTLLLVAAGYAVTRAVGRSRGGVGWVVLAGVALGVAFLTKQGQALLVLPALATVVLAAAPGPVWRRLGRLLAGGLAMVVAAGWWVALVELTPAAQRPYVGGSTGNSILELTFGYNGLGRLTGQESGGGAANRVRAGSWFRLFGSGGDQAGWLLPAAIVLLVAGWVAVRRAPRRDPQRAGLLLWGGWLVVVGIVLSGLKGISHSYYAIELAPAVAALVAIGGSVLWAGMDRVRWARPVLATTVGISAGWSVALLLHKPAWTVAAAPVVVVAGALAAAGLLVAGRRAWTHARPAVLAAGLVAVLAGPLVWSVATAESIHRGSNPTAGPGVTFLDTPAGIEPSTRVPVAVADQVRAGAAGFDWAAAMVGRHAADLQLTSGVAIRELGGYTGNDPNPRLPEFQGLVAAGRVHYLVLERAGSKPGAQTAAATVVDWALAHHRATRQHGWTIIDLTRPSPGALAGTASS